MSIDAVPWMGDRTVDELIVRVWKLRMTKETEMTPKKAE
jgi:hypothetical protein